jgi:hypothetical protein
LFVLEVWTGHVRHAEGEERSHRLAVLDEGMLFKPNMTQWGELEEIARVWETCRCNVGSRWHDGQDDAQAPGRMPIPDELADAEDIGPANDAWRERRLGLLDLLMWLSLLQLLLLWLELLLRLRLLLGPAHLLRLRLLRLLGLLGLRQLLLLPLAWLLRSLSLLLLLMLLLLLLRRRRRLGLRLGLHLDHLNPPARSFDTGKVLLAEITGTIPIVGRVAHQP